MQRIYRMNLKDGDRLVANLAAPRRHGAHPVMTELRMRNGEEFDYSTLFNRPSKTTELALQLFYYLVVSFIMLSILTSVGTRRAASCATAYGACWPPPRCIWSRRSRSGVRDASC